MLRRLFLFALPPLLALGAAFGAWEWANARLKSGWGDWAEARRAEGWRVEHGAPERGPVAALQVALRLPAFRLAAPEGQVPGGFAYRAEAVTLTLSPRDLAHLAFRPEGAQAVTLAGSELPVSARALSLRLALADGSARLEGEALRIGAAEPLSVGSGWAAFRPGQAEFAADRLSHPDWRVMGGPMDSLAGQLALAPASLEVRRAELRWGRVTAELSGRLAPDAQLRPAGRLALRLRGAEAALDALAAAGLLPGPAAPAARVVLRLSTRDPGDGGGPVVELPVELRDGALTVARIPVLRLPPLAWRP